MVKKAKDKVEAPDPIPEQDKLQFIEQMEKVIKHQPKITDADIFEGIFDGQKVPTKQTIHNRKERKKLKVMKKK